MTHYDIHIDTMDLYASQRVAANQARRDQMPKTGERHDALATHIENARNWAQANCPPGFTYRTMIRFEIIPAVNPVYNGSRGDIYSHNKEG